LYKATDFYAPEYERTVAWNDPALKIVWQIDSGPEASAVVSGAVVSDKDQRGALFHEAEKFD
jgi:dTDP-4-dehydrorhamnose 3,5-epimerase